MQDDDLTSKERKTARKMASKLDRSKFKKTDRVKWADRQKRETEEKLLKLDLIEGRVLMIKPDEIVVDHQGEPLICKIGGILKKEAGSSKNILAVGDFVLIEKASFRIASVRPRKTVLSRTDHLRRRKEQIIASNIDLVLITVSALCPPLKPALIDRYLMASLKGGMQPVIVINKIDLLEVDTPEYELYQDVQKLYKNLQIPIFGVSVQTGEGLDALKSYMKDKACVFSGQSGVGKSSLINAITGLDLPVGELRRLQKGAHTTTAAQLVPLSFGGWCIDTPGIRSFGVWDLTEQDLRDYFPDIFEKATHCRYPNCSHTHEPDCAVQAAVEAGELSILRFESYLKLLTEKHEKDANEHA
jgi:ribosome biogenesis GTPase